MTETTKCRVGIDAGIDFLLAYIDAPAGAEVVFRQGWSDVDDRHIIMSIDDDESQSLALTIEQCHAFANVCDKMANSLPFNATSLKMLADNVREAASKESMQ